MRGSGGGATEGTLIFDASDSRIKLKTQQGWKDLSGKNGKSNSNELNGLVENQNAKIIIGAETTTADGILVLESNSQVLVLPKVNDFADIVDPSPGMMGLSEKQKIIGRFQRRILVFLESRMMIFY